MLTLFPKFKKRLILFEVLYVALMVVLYILKPGANSIAMLLMLLVGHKAGDGHRADEDDGRRHAGAG